MQLPALPEDSPDGSIPNGKTGTVWTATMHIFCAVVGAGVLGLPRSLAWMGWVAGPICLLVFFLVALWTSRLLAEVYYVNGVEHARYHHAIVHLLGRKHAIVATVFQVATLVLVDIAYTVTGATSMKTIARELGSSWDTTWQLTLLMGGLELVFSQLPSLESVWWVSGLGTLSSLTYASITLILGLVYSGNHLGTVGGISATPASKAWGVLNSLGNMAFAYSFCQILLEIQDTLRQPPSSVPQMKRAINIAESAAFTFYFSVAVTSYLALGNDVPGDVLEGYEQAPAWCLIVANLAVCIHMITAYQVLAQPMFDMIESQVKAFQIRRSKRLKQQKEDNGTTSAEAHNGKQLQEDSDGAAPQAKQQLGGASFVEQCRVSWSRRVSSTKDVEGGATLSLQETQVWSQLSGMSSIRLNASGLSVLNSAPIPDLLPEEPELKSNTKLAATLAHRRHSHKGGHRHNCPCERCAVDRGSAISPAGSGESKATGSASTRRLARSVSSALLGSQDAMYARTTGATNEHVPLNDSHWYLPFWQRLIIRSLYVAVVTVIACVMPFFNAIVGLVGSLTFFPLCIYMPFKLWTFVYKPRGAHLALIHTTAVVMLLVSLAALTASVENIIVSWQTFTFFGE